ncbi:MAG: alpha/beta fold hydrolase [Stenotrophomonas sp.]
MLHGNPSWSYLWRHLVNGLSDKYRCIVPDHIGMGLSDKPDDSRYDYTLQSRVDDLTALLDHLGISGPVTLAVHDWGGMIGFGWALAHHAQVKRLVITNTAAFPLPAEKPMPWQIAMGRHWKPGEWFIRTFNAFSAGASWLGVRGACRPRCVAPTWRRMTAGTTASPPSVSCRTSRCRRPTRPGRCWSAPPRRCRPSPTGRRSSPGACATSASTIISSPASARRCRRPR